MLPLELSAGMSAVDAAIQKKIYGSGTTALKLDSHLPKIFVLFASLKVHKKWWKMVFIPS